MIVSWLFIAAAAMGQTTQPANQPAGANAAQAAPRIRVVVPDNRSGATAKPEPRVTASAPASTTPPIPPGTSETMEGLSGAPINIQATESGIVITGESQDVKFLQDIARLIEERPEATFQVFPLKNATASDIATNLQKLWEQAKAGAGGRVPSEDRLTVIPEARANLLMIAANPKNMEQIAGLINQLDQPSLAERVNFTPIPLKYIKATEAQQLVNDLLQTLQKQFKVDRQLFNLQADMRTNSLLVAGPEADIEQIRHLIELIDVPPTLEGGGVVKVALFPLEKAIATEMAKSLSDMLQANTKTSEASKEQIRRLQVVLRKQGSEKALPDLDLEKPIKILAEEGSNSLIVQTTEANLAAVGELIGVLDTVPVSEEMLVKLFPLKFADADALRQNLSEMFSQGKQLPQLPDQPSIGRVPPGLPGAALVYNVALSADKRTNTLVVAGRPEQVYLVTQVITAIDVAENPNRYPPRLVRVQYADVKRIQEAVQKLADLRKEMATRLSPSEQERERILVVPDERTSSLVVIARDDNFAEIQELVAKLDTAEDKWLGEIHIINLTDPLAATDVATKVDDLWARRTEQRQQAGLPQDKPKVVADARSNSLVISANKEDYEAISKLVQQLQQLPLSPMQDIRQIVLKHNDATKLADMINRIFDERLKHTVPEGGKTQPSDRVFITADAVTNTLLVVSAKAPYEDVVRLVTQLDVPPMVEGTMRTFFIKNTDVTQAADMLQKLFDKGIYRGSGPQEVPAGQKQVTIIPDVRSSALIVSASPENLSIVESVLKDVDRVDVPVFQADTTVIPIRNADVARVAGQLNDLMEGLRKALKDQGDQFQLTVIPNTRSNSLILSGSRVAIQRAREIVPSLDQAVETTAIETHVYKLQQASAGRLQSVLTDLFEKREPTGGQGNQQKTPVLVIADDAANALIVSASRDMQAEVARLVERLDVPTSLAQQMQVITLEKAKADSIATTLQDLVKAQAGTSSSASAFSVTADPRTNSLVVFAPPDLMTSVRDIVRRLDTTEPKEVLAMRVFRLQNAQAEDLSKLLEDFFKTAGQGQGNDLRQMIIRFTPVNPETGLPVMDPATGERVMRTLVHQDVTIKPDPYTNSLLVMAPSESIDMMEMLVHMLDSIEPRTAKIQAFELRNADAEEMSKLLQDLFKPTGGNAQNQGRQLVIAGGEGGAMGGSTPGAAGSEEEISFAIDRRTNTLIAAGTPAQLKIVESLVFRLDDQDAEERVVRVVPLQYATNDDVAKTLTSFFESESQLIQKAEEGAAASRELQRQVTIESAGESTNSLLISYSPRLESQIVTMINELDRPPPQVMIQVLMAEVTLDDRFEFGMEFALQDLLFSEKAYLGPNGTIQGDNFDFIGGTDLGAAGSGLGGASFTITGEDFNFLVRALQVEGRLEVLSRPALLVQDNQEATIKVGERVPVVRDLAVTGTGTVTPSVDYEDVGVNLDVKPIINPDGFVNMEIAPEISALGVSSVSIGSGVTLPTFTQRKAETSVTVKDGETIIIGGLITSRTQESENKVPVLGDIPLLGNAFRATTRQTTKTELLMVLTPHVVRNEEDARTISVEMRDQTGMMDDVRTTPLMQGLQIKPEDDQLGPVDHPQGDDSLEPAPKQKEKGGTGGEMGPSVEEFGPPTTSIEFGPERGTVAIRE